MTTITVPEYVTKSQNFTNYNKNVTAYKIIGDSYVNMFFNSSYKPFVENTDTYIAELFLYFGAKIDEANESGYTALFKSVLNNDIDSAKYFLSRGANPNVTTSDDRTALCQAIYNKNIHMTIHLLRYNADFTKDCNGVTPIGITNIMSDTYTRFLLQKVQKIKAVSPNSIDKDSKSNDTTALFQSVLNNNIDAVKDYLFRGANPNVANNGITPLCQSTYNKNIYMTIDLLRYNADYTKDCNGITPIEIANRTGEFDIRFVLQKTQEFDVAGANSDANIGHEAL